MDMRALRRQPSCAILDVAEAGSYLSSGQINRRLGYTGLNLPRMRSSHQYRSVWQPIRRRVVACKVEMDGI